MTHQTNGRALTTLRHVQSLHKSGNSQLLQISSDMHHPKKNIWCCRMVTEAFS